MTTTLRTYRVHMTLEHPGWDSADGQWFEVEAPTKREACKKAKQASDREGFESMGQGRRYFRAEVSQ